MLSALKWGTCCGREQFFHQRAQTVRLLHDDLGVFAQGRLFQFLLQQLRRAAYAAQRILDLVREVAQQQAIGLRLVQHLLFARQLERPVDRVELQQQAVSLKLHRRCRATQVQLAVRMRAERQVVLDVAGAVPECRLHCVEQLLGIREGLLQRMSRTGSCRSSRTDVPLPG